MQREVYRDPLDPMIYWVPVQRELLAEMGEWSEPVQVRIGEHGMEFRKATLELWTGNLDHLK